MGRWLGSSENLDFHKAQLRWRLNVTRWEARSRTMDQLVLASLPQVLNPGRGSIRPDHGLRCQLLEPAPEACSQLLWLEVSSRFRLGTYLSDVLRTGNVAIVAYGMCCALVRLETRKRSGRLLLFTISDSLTPFAENKLLNPVDDAYS